MVQKGCYRKITWDLRNEMIIFYNNGINFSLLEDKYSRQSRNLKASNLF